MRYTDEKFDPKKAAAHIYAQNGQWAVTGYGLETVKPWEEYPIEASDLARRWSGDDPLYDWPMHLASKDWVDIDLFLEAFRHALYIHTGRYGEPPSFHLFHRTMIHACRRSQTFHEMRVENAKAR